METLEKASSAIIQPGRRAQKKKDTRSQLARVAQRLFIEQGFDETSMEEIAQQAGVSRRTCFRYFPSKEALAFPFREHRLARFDALICGGPPQETPYEAVKRACLVMAGEYMSRREDVVSLEHLVRAHPQLRARERENDRHWEAVIARALARSKDDRLAGVVGGAVMGAVRSAFELWLESDGRLNLIELVQQVFVLLDHGAPALLAQR